MTSSQSSSPIAAHVVGLGRFRTPSGNVQCLQVAQGSKRVRRQRRDSRDGVEHPDTTIDTRTPPPPRVRGRAVSSYVATSHGAQGWPSPASNTYKERTDAPRPRLEGATGPETQRDSINSMKVAVTALSAFAELAILQPWTVLRTRVHTWPAPHTNMPVMSKLALVEAMAHTPVPLGGTQSTSSRSWPG